MSRSAAQSLLATAPVRRSGCWMEVFRASRSLHLVCQRKILVVPEPSTCSAGLDDLLDEKALHRLVVDNFPVTTYGDCCLRYPFLRDLLVGNGLFLAFTFLLRAAYSLRFEIESSSFAAARDADIAASDLMLVIYRMVGLFVAQYQSRKELIPNWIDEMN